VEADMKDRILRNTAVTVAGLLGAVGVVLVGLSSWAPVVVAIVGAAVGTAVTAAQMHVDPPHDVAQPSEHTFAAVRAGAAAAAATTAVLLVAAGIIGLLGVAASGYVIPLMLAAAVPWAWRHRADLRRSLTVRPVEVPPQPAVAVPWTDPGILSVPQLCQAWHRSYWMLHDLPAGPARTEMVGNRERLLDELERRDPAGFDRWMHSGTPASSNPSRHLTDNRTDFGGGQAPPAP
jgi:hypothetical protein